MLLDAIQVPANANPMGSLIFIGFLSSVVLWTVLTFVPFRAWYVVRKRKLDITLVNLMGIRMRHIRPFAIIEPMTRAKEAGVEIDILDLEGHTMAGGDIDAAVDAMIASKQKGEELSFEAACAQNMKES